MVLTLGAACASARPPSDRDIADANDTGRTLTADTAAERELLRRLPQLRAGTPQSIGEDSVVAEPAYTAASGRTCRALWLTSGKAGNTSHRVACSNGSEWFFVPDVFGSRPD